MKKTLLLLSIQCLLFASAFSQGNSPVQQINNNVVYRINGATQNLIIGRDTVIRRMDSAYAFIALKKTGDSISLFAFDSAVSKKWRKISGGGTGTGNSPVQSIFGRIGAVTASSSDYADFYPLLTGSYQNPDFIASLPYSKITGAPSFLRTADTAQMLLPYQHWAADYLKRTGHTANRILWSNASGAVSTNSDLTYDGATLNIGNAGFGGTNTVSINGGRGQLQASGTGWRFIVGSTNPFDASKAYSFMNGQKEYLKIGSLEPVSANSHFFRLTPGVELIIDSLRGTGEAPVVVTATGALKRGTGSGTGSSYDAGTATTQGLFWTGSTYAPRNIAAADVPTLNQNTTGTASNITATSNSTLTSLPSLSLSGSQVSGNISGSAANVTGTVALSNGGTGATTAAGARTALELDANYLKLSDTVTVDFSQFLLKSDTVTVDLTEYAKLSANNAFTGDNSFNNWSRFNETAFFNADLDFITPGKGIYFRDGSNNRFLAFQAGSSGGLSLTSKDNFSIGVNAYDPTPENRRQVMQFNTDGSLQMPFQSTGGPSTTGGWTQTRLLGLNASGFLINAPIDSFAKSVRINGTTYYPDITGRIDLGTISGAEGVAGVSSFNSRTGAVIPDAGDYSSFYAPVNHAHAFGTITGSIGTGQLASGTPSEGYVPKFVGGSLVWSADATGSGSADPNAALVNQSNTFQTGFNQTFNGDATFGTGSFVQFQNGWFSAGNVYLNATRSLYLQDGSGNRYEALNGDNAGGIGMYARTGFAIFTNNGTSGLYSLKIENDGMMYWPQYATSLAKFPASGWGGVSKYLALTASGQVVTTDAPSGTGTLQTVTDAGATTTNKITATGFNSGNQSSQSALNAGFELYNSGGNYYGFNLGYFGGEYATTAIMPAGGDFVVATSNGAGTQAGLSKMFSVDGSTGGTQIASLAGTGSRTVIADAAGLLSARALAAADLPSDVVYTAATQTLTEKRIIKKVITVASPGTIAAALDLYNQVNITALANTLTIEAPTGTPTSGETLIFRIKDNGTARAITWNTGAGGFRPIEVTLPTTTVAGKVHYIAAIYNAAENFFDVVSVLQQQ